MNYNQVRLDNIIANEKVLASLGFPSINADRKEDNDGNEERKKRKIVSTQQVESTRKSIRLENATKMQIGIQEEYICTLCNSN